EIPEINHAVDIRHGFHDIQVGLLHLVDQRAAIPDAETLIVRFSIALCGYASKLEGQRKAPMLSPEIHSTLRPLLAHLIATKLNVNFPDVLDGISNGDMKQYCGPFWNCFAD